MTCRHIKLLMAFLRRPPSGERRGAVIAWLATGCFVRPRRVPLRRALAQVTSPTHRRAATRCTHSCRLCFTCPVERLVLWDIDLTLVNMAGVGHALLAHALRATTGVELVHRPDLGGRTDRDLVTEVLTRHGVTVAEPLIERMYLEMAAAAHERTGHMRSVGTALPGALAALAALATIPGVVQTVVTGNTAPTARLKLAAVDLDSFIDFDIGGYGSESTIRGELVNLARSRAALKHGVTLTDKAVIVIGDTVNDIIGAKYSGAIAMAVATGRTPAAELHAAGADLVLTSLADTRAVITAITD